jgi:hypothetical protein
MPPQENTMPDAKDNEKRSGDIRPPEVEKTGPAGAEEQNEVESVPGRGENQAGFVKDRDLSGGSGRQPS